MLNFTFRGLCSPVFTFFNEDLSVNIKIIPKYAKFLADNGVPGVLDFVLWGSMKERVSRITETFRSNDGAMLARVWGSFTRRLATCVEYYGDCLSILHGTSGEAMSMTVAERKAVAEEWAKAVKTTKQHLMVQVSGCPLPDAIELAKHAESIGVDSILALPELYFKPNNPLAVVNYLKHIGEAAPKTPLLYYHIPGWTTVDINVAEMMNLAVDRLPTFVGIKYTSNDLDRGVAALKANNGKYAVFLGADTLMCGAFAMGFDSVIATTLNMLPQYAVGIQKAINENDVEKARILQGKVSEACSIITKDGAWVPTMKVAMSLTTDLNPGPSRPPLTNLTKEETQQMKNSLKSLKIIE